MSRCPHCFQALSEDRYAFMCVSGRCERKLDPVASALHGSDVSVAPWVRVERPPRARGWVPPVEVPCASCSQPGREVCPECRYELPPGWRQTVTLCVAMAGARATGKSVFVGVLVKLLGQLCEARGTSLVPAEPRTADTYRTVYERALFEQRGLLEPTPAARTASSYQRHPLVYSLGRVSGRPVSLVVRDVAGEELESADTDTRHLEFFAHADGVLFMFDPLRVPEVRDQLHDLVPAELISGGEPQQVLAKVMHLIGDGPARLAVILSKFDAMQFLSRVEGTSWNRVMSQPGAAFLRDRNSPADAYDDVDGQLLHQEVRSLLQRLGATSIVSAVERPHRGRPVEHRFFSVSALGEPANGESLHERGISPFRCLDPLRWLMSRSGALS